MSNPVHNVSLYARSSSDEQARKGLSVPAQLKTLRQWAQQEGWSVISEFADDGISGRTDRRPAFQQMIAAACTKEHAVDAILVWKFDRYSRSDEDPIVYKGKLRKHGVRVLSYNERFDDSAAGRFGENLSHALAHYFSENLATDIRRGKEGAISRGYFPGGQCPPGYQVLRTLDSTGVVRSKLMPDPLTAPIFLEVFRQYLAGCPRRLIMAYLQEQLPSRRWHPDSLLYLLKNPVYAGAVSIRRRTNGQAVIAWDAHEGIIDRQTWERVQLTMQSRAPTHISPRTLNSPYLLSGLLTCAHCGSAVCGFATPQQWQSKLTGENRRKIYRYYWCTRPVKFGKTACPEAKRRRQEVLEQLVLDDLFTVLSDEVLLEEITKSTRKHMEKASRVGESEEKKRQGQLTDIDRRLARLYEAVETASLQLEDVAPRIQALRQQRTELTAIDMSHSGIYPPPPPDFAALRLTAQKMRELMRSQSVGERKTLLRECFREIRLSREDVLLCYRFGGLERRVRL